MRQSQHLLDREHHVAKLLDREHHVAKLPVSTYNFRVLLKSSFLKLLPSASPEHITPETHHISGKHISRLDFTQANSHCAYLEGGDSPQDSLLVRPDEQARRTKYVSIQLQSFSPCGCHSLVASWGSPDDMPLQQTLEGVRTFVQLPND